MGENCKLPNCIESNYHCLYLFKVWTMVKKWSVLVIRRWCFIYGTRLEIPHSETLLQSILEVQRWGNYCNRSYICYNDCSGVARIFGRAGLSRTRTCLPITFLQQSACALCTYQCVAPLPPPGTYGGIFDSEIFSHTGGFDLALRSKDCFYNLFYVCNCLELKKPLLTGFDHGILPPPEGIWSEVWSNPPCLPDPSRGGGSGATHW